MPDPQLIQRFRSALDTGGYGEAQLGVAVSGGPDSLALLLLAHAAFPGQVAAASVDHGLRPANAQEATMVAGVCAELGVPHTILSVEVASGNVQSEARAARYAALGRWFGETGRGVLLTAHHADDQAETLLMRLNRGSGLAGLAGIRTHSVIPFHGGALYRPLLGWRKAELEALVAKAGLEAAQDPSNADDRFDRARMRKALADADWLDVEGLARSAALLDAAMRDFEWLAAREYDRQVRRIGARLVYRPMAVEQVQLLVMERVIAGLGGDAPLSALSRLRDRLLGGEGGNLAGVLVTPVGDAWRFEKEPPRRTG